LEADVVGSAVAGRPAIRRFSIFDAAVVGYSVDRIAIVFAVALLVLMFKFFLQKQNINSLPKIKIKLSNSGSSCC
jgi:hypothetical protein